MTLSLELDRGTKHSLYRQIAEQIKTQINNGRLPAGSRLPTVRQLAVDMGVTRLTIQSAYSELQADGWVESVVGRGTFVSQDIYPQELRSSIGHCLTADGVLSDILESSMVLGVRSMAIAEPDSTHFPIDEFWGNLTRLRPKADTLLGYSLTQGDPELRVAITQLLEELNIDAVPEDILVTNGVMHALSLVTQALADAKEHVVIEQPTFLGYLNILRSMSLISHPVHIEKDGPDLNQLERYFYAHRPQFFYTIPNFQNPTGYVWSLEKRQATIALAQRYNVLILEDDIYGYVNFGQPLPPRLKHLDPERVVYLGGFSKALMPGLRIGFILAPQHLNGRLLSLRRANDLCGAGITQRALAHFIFDGGLKRHLRRTLPIYQKRRNTLLNAMQREMPHSTRWTRPQGGYSTWVTLPRQSEPGTLYRRALEEGFIFTPGDAYQIDDPDHEHLRLCFGNQTNEGIRAGVALVARLIREGV